MDQVEGSDEPAAVALLDGLPTQADATPVTGDLAEDLPALLEPEHEAGLGGDPHGPFEPPTFGVEDGCREFQPGPQPLRGPRLPAGGQREQVLGHVAVPATGAPQEEAGVRKASCDPGGDPPRWEGYPQEEKGPDGR